jgi:hypothetical protein
MSIHLSGLITVMLTAFALAGCASLDLGEAFPRVGFADEQAPTATGIQAGEKTATAKVQTTSAVTCPADDWVDLPRDEDVERHWKAVKNKLVETLGIEASPELSIVLGAFRSRLAPPGRSTNSTVTTISVSDLKQLAKQLHQKVTVSPLTTNLSVSKTTDPRLHASADDEQLLAEEELFSYSLYYYFDALFNDQYYDRSGAKVPAPKLSMTVTDADLSSVLTVFADAIMDFVERRPVWVTQDGVANIPIKKPYSGGYFPGPQNTANEGEPTAVEFEYDDDMQKINTRLHTQWAPLRKIVDKLTDTSTPADLCDLDRTKSDAIYHVSQLVSQGVSGITGWTFGNFGGMGFSFFGYVKFSVGDNKTVEVLLKTLLARLGERVSTTGTYRVLRGFNDSQFTPSKIVTKSLVLINPSRE